MVDGSMAKKPRIPELGKRRVQKAERKRLLLKRGVTKEKQKVLEGGPKMEAFKKVLVAIFEKESPNSVLTEQKEEINRMQGIIQRQLKLREHSVIAGDARKSLAARQQSLVEIRRIINLMKIPDKWQGYLQANIPRFIELRRKVIRGAEKEPVLLGKDIRAEVGGFLYSKGINPPEKAILPYVFLINEEKTFLQTLQRFAKVRGIKISQKQMSFLEERIDTGTRLINMLKRIPRMEIGEKTQLIEYFQKKMKTRP